MSLVLGVDEFHTLTYLFQDVAKERVLTWKCIIEHKVCMPLAKKKYIEPKFSKVQYAKLDDSTSGESALIFAKNWVQHCTRTHTRCPPSYPKRAPTRLLKVHNDACQLYTTQETQIGYPYYATLSHCCLFYQRSVLTRVR